MSNQEQPIQLMDQ